MHTPVSDLPSLKMEEVVNLLDCLPNVSLWVKNSQGQFLAANQNLAKQFQAKDRREIIGKTDFDFVPFHLAKEYVNDDQEVFKSGRMMKNKMELITGQENKLSWSSTTKVPLTDEEGRVVAVMGFTQKLDKEEAFESSDQSIDAIAGYINENYPNSLSIKELAHQVNLSVIQFERQFKRIFHTTPLKYINNIRIKAAGKLLLHTNLKLSAIAKQTGFKDQSYFTKQFYKYLGILPKDYRALYRDPSRTLNGQANH